ncbi:Protein DHS-20 [Aphelenchoides avenae]|nr:Protein DHS-20 [Aphelenchus avenae]
MLLRRTLLLLSGAAVTRRDVDDAVGVDVEGDLNLGDAARRWRDADGRAAKHAAESYMDTIRHELRPFGITCCIIEPGIFRTGLIGQEAMMERVNRVWSRLPEETKEEYGEKFKNT